MFPGHITITKDGGGDTLNIRRIPDSAAGRGTIRCAA